MDIKVWDTVYAHDYAYGEWKTTELTVDSLTKTAITTNDGRRWRRKDGTPFPASCTRSSDAHHLVLVTERRHLVLTFHTLVNSLDNIRHKKHVPQMSDSHLREVCTGLQQVVDLLKEVE